MWSKLIFFSLMSAFLLFAIWPANRTQANAESNYVKLEVKGKLVLAQEGTSYAIESSDGHFPQIKLLVKLARTEDKNRALDRYLDDLKGKLVVVTGFLDCRNVGQEQGVIYLYLQNQSQIIAVEDK
jgi:hypothetical protein